MASGMEMAGVGIVENGKTGRRLSKRANIALWILQALLAALYLFAGIMKLAMPIEPMAAQARLPGGFLQFIGVMETLGGLGLILPGIFRIWQTLTPIAATGLTIIMVGASILGISRGEMGTSLIPLGFGMLCALVAWTRFRWRN